MTASIGIPRVSVIDSHTGGEPTRVVISGGPDLGSGSLEERRARFRDCYDDFRSAVVNEPRGSDVLVGALLCEPTDPRCAAGVIFFNNVGYLGMCGHGLIGLTITLAHLKRIGPGTHKIETPVGIVSVQYSGGSKVTIANVPSLRIAANVAVTLDDGTSVTGDIAWGGNWFFLVDQSSHARSLELARTEELLAFSWRIREALVRNGITGENGEEIDHVELFGPPADPENQSRNFVLCPGKAYDRSPCGTGTSAKIACLATAGKLAPGEIWRQESILGSVFEGSYEISEGLIVPSVRGSAFITAESTLLLDPRDPFQMGIRT